MLKIAVITPYFEEALSILRRCHDSVMSQCVGVDHFLVADGRPMEEVDQWNAKHVRLPSAHSDYGNTPRGVGGMLASVEGYDFVAYLDADNWFHPGHLESLLTLREQTGADVCCSFRTFHTQDGREMVGVWEPDEDAFAHVDTSCFFIHRDAFGVLDLWLRMPRILSSIGDRVFFKGVASRGFKLATSRKRTVAYRSQYKLHYQVAGLTPPQGSKDNVGGEAYAWLGSEQGRLEAYRRLGFSPL